MQLTEFLRANQPEGFSRKPYRSHEGDSLTYFVADRSHYAQRVDEVLTVYLDEETHEVVGCKIKGVRRLQERLGKFDVAIQDDGMPFGSFVLAGMAYTDEPSVRMMYERVGVATRGVRVDREQLEECCS